MDNQLQLEWVQLEQILEFQDPKSIKKQKKIVQHISGMGLKGLELLLDLLIARRIDRRLDVSYVDGIIFDALYTSDSMSIRNRLSDHFQEGIIDLNSELTINYQPLQNSLIRKQFQEADKITQLQLCELAGLRKIDNRNWLYFTDIYNLPVHDLYTIDQLWRIYSQGLFGFSVQRQIWLANNRDWNKLWHKIGWKYNNIACRYPKEFIWDTSAPIGHLPLFNQLRGVQVLSALFDHPAWTIIN